MTSFDLPSTATWPGRVAFRGESLHGVQWRTRRSVSEGPPQRLSVDHDDAVAGPLGPVFKRMTVPRLNQRRTGCIVTRNPVVEGKKMAREHLERSNDWMEQPSPPQIVLECYIS